MKKRYDYGVVVDNDNLTIKNITAYYDYIKEEILKIDDEEKRKIYNFYFKEDFEYIDYLIKRNDLKLIVTVYNFISDTLIQNYNISHLKKLLRKEKILRLIDE